MVWVIYPKSFEPGLQVPRRREWIEWQAGPDKYPEFLSGLIAKETHGTPGCSIVVVKYLLTAYQTSNWC